MNETSTVTPQVDGSADHRGSDDERPPAFDPRTCPRINPSWCEQMGFYPNRFHWGPGGDRRVVFLVLQPSARSGDYALNKASLDYLADAVSAGRVAVGTVVLLKNGKSHLELPVAEVARHLNGLDGANPREGTYGPYWWINDQGRVAGMEDDDAPF